MKFTFCHLVDGDDSDDIKKSASHKSDNYKELHVLICNGANDPFTSIKDIQALEQLFKENTNGCNNRWKVINYPNVKHGFTNPAQGFNTNDNFDYNENAAVDSWNNAVNLLRKVML